ncbi:MAG: 3-deoxy-8-phosphooctulonate synthase [candidate division Zixibacteria bacterium]|nr:3-deoxy-8-phosphooctulonate synthase [candidate division Zixibacteria bacterium]
MTIPVQAVRPFPIGDLTVGGPDLLWIMGPCLLESEDMALRVAQRLADEVAKSKRQIVFKGSFDKANRMRGDSPRGHGIEEGIKILGRVKAETGLPVTTDIHHPEDAVIAAAVVDLLQIPAFLCRQTDFVIAAARTMKPVNIKKGQFLSPRNMEHVASKAVGAGNADVILTERGTTFGYGDLVVDCRSLPIMRRTGFPVCFDASHSVQSPGAGGGRSGGQREFLLPLIRAALAVGVDAIFCEVHPDPPHAASDRETQWPLDQIDDVFRNADPLEDHRRSILELENGC